MKSRRLAWFIGSLAAMLSVTSLYLVGCNPGKPAAIPVTPSPSPTSTILASHTPIIPPTNSEEMPATASPASSSNSLLDTSWKDFTITDFGNVHASLDQDANQHLIFGGLQVSPSTANLSPDLAAFLGRWEGPETVPEGYAPSQAVLFVQQID